jgi:hypothetical protein
MSSVSTAPAGQKPAPSDEDPAAASVPGYRGRVGQRWGGGVIAAIVVVVLMAGGVTVAMSVTAPPAHAAGGQILIGNGISITPAPGWTLAKQDRMGQFLFLQNSDGSAQLYVGLYKSHKTDVGQALSEGITNIINSNNYTNVQQGQPQQKSLQGKNFQQEDTVTFSANWTDPQGNTGTDYGVWGTLLNPSTTESAFMNMFAVDNDSANAATPDFNTMVSSMA